MEDKIQEENKDREETLLEEKQTNKRKSSNSSVSSGSDDSSESSGDEKDKSDLRQQPAKKESQRASKSESKEKQRSLSRSASKDSDNRRERSKKYRSDEKFEPKSQTSGSYRRGRDRDSRSRSNERKFSDKKKNVIYKPTLEGPLLSLKQFMEYQRYEVDPVKGEKVYEKYKSEYQEKQNQIFFQEHRQDEWFKEKYDLVLSEKFKEERRADARINAEKFFAELKNNTYDSINLNYEDYAHKNQVTEQASNVHNQIEEEKEQQEKVLNNVTEVRLEAHIDITGSPFFGFDPNAQTLFIKSIPRHVSRWDLTEAFKKLSGFVSLSLSEPLKSQEFIRFGWILFDTDDNCQKAFEYLKSLYIKGHAFQVVKSRSQRKSMKICENIDKQRILADLELSRKLIEALDEEKDIRGNPLVKNPDQNEPSKQFDLQTLYLRKVHSYCFYCAAEYADERMLVAKCGSAHLRRLKLQSDEPIPDLPDWHKKITEIIRNRIAECTRKPPKTLEEIEKKAEEEFDIELREKCERVSQKHGNWPCKYCQKIFKEDHFVIKHIKTKHPEKFEQIRETKMYASFAADKHKINTVSGGYQGNRNFQRNQGHQGGRKYDHRRGGFQGSKSNRGGYRDLDDPKAPQGRGSRTVVDYGDL